MQKLLECDGPFLLMPCDRFYKYAQENFPPTMLETRYDPEYEDWVMYVSQQDVKVLRNMYCNPLATSHGVASNSCSTTATIGCNEAAYELSSPAAVSPAVSLATQGDKANVDMLEKMLETDEALAGEMQRQQEAGSGHSAEDAAKVWETVVADSLLAHKLEQQELGQQELEQVH